MFTTNELLLRAYNPLYDPPERTQVRNRRNVRYIGTPIGPTDESIGGRVHHCYP